MMITIYWQLTLKVHTINLVYINVYVCMYGTY